MSEHVKDAFDTICNEAKQSEAWYVTLVEYVPYYGGPEEGGWHGHDMNIVAFQQFQSEELAHEARDKVMELAKQLTDDAARSYGEQCLRESEWLDSRGLDDDFLREPDGHANYSVIVSQGILEPVRGDRHYS